MSDYTQMAALGMAPLRHNVRVRVLSLHDAQKVPEQIVRSSTKSPFYFAAGTQFFVTSKTESDLDMALTERELALTAVTKAGGSAAPITQGVRVQLTLPEMALGDTYAALAKTRKMPAYLEFRNQIYLRLAAKLDQTATLFTLLGASLPQRASADWSSLTQYAATFKPHAVGEMLGTVGLVGQNFDKQGVLAVEIDVPMVVGVNVAALRLLRDTFWALLDAQSAPADLAAYLNQFYGTDYTLPVLTTPIAAPTTSTVRQILLQTVGRGGDIRQLAPHTSLYQLHLGNQQRLIGGGALGLNSDAAVALSQDRFARRTVLNAAGLATPLAGVYTSQAQLIADWQSSFRTKAIVLKTRHQGQGVSDVFLTPPSEQQLRARSSALPAGDEWQVETFQSGDVFRLLVLNGIVLGVLAIDYAYVVGDGRQSVRVLLQHKNTHNRALGYPELALDERVQEYLQLQGVADDSVVTRGSQVYLGRNSLALAAGSHRNGVQELDVSYHQVAIQAAAALGLKLCTVDLAVVNSYVPLDSEQEGQVSVVGITAMPDLHPFEQPTYGDSQPVAVEVVDAIFK